MTDFIGRVYAAAIDFAKGEAELAWFLIRFILTGKGI